MKTNTILLLLCTLLISICLSCIDIFEKDLAGEKVELLAPADSLITQEKTQKFWWSYISGALWYELQVVSPDFSNVSSLELDTILENNNFQFTLQLGVYHWRVKAINGSSSTDYSEHSLIIIETPQKK